MLKKYIFLALPLNKSQNSSSNQTGKDECGSWHKCFQGKQMENTFGKPEVYLFSKSLVLSGNLQLTDNLLFKKNKIICLLRHRPLIRLIN